MHKSPECADLAECLEERSWGLYGDLQIIIRAMPCGEQWRLLRDVAGVPEDGSIWCILKTLHAV